MTNENSTVTKSDPTINVKEMIDNAVERVDDLRIVEVKRIDEKFDYIDERLKESDVKYQIQFSAAKDGVGIALIAQEKAVAAALEGTKEAITKNDANTDKRFDLLSEKIDGVVEAISKTSGQTGIYVTHTDLSIALDRLQSNIEATLRPVVTFMNSQTGRDKGIGISWGALLSIVSLIGGIIAIFIAIGIK